MLPLSLVRCLVLAITTTVVLCASPLLPKWPPTYQMNLSTIIMTCNTSGYMNNDAVQRLSKYGIVDIDWSNAKQQWANAKPMDCQQRLLAQAQAIKQVNPHTRVWVYRNLVKALPWFSDVREKLIDPQYSSWFVQYKSTGPYHMPPCTGTKCSMAYHDQLQTPEHDPGRCVDECDCGAGLPCGEYIWDHRNTSLRTWLVKQYIMGPEAVGNAAIDGLFIDDGWSDTQQPILPWMPSTGYCDHNVFGGPSEEDYKCIDDMGLTQADVHALTVGWQETMTLTFNTLVNANSFSWQQFTFIQGSPNASECTSWFRANGRVYEDAPVQFTYTQPLNNDTVQFKVDLAVFLLVRGQYAWLGYTWNTCHDEWVYRWDAMLDLDYGEPTSVVEEIANGVFQRTYTKSTITMDCNAYLPKFTFPQDNYQPY